MAPRSAQGSSRPVDRGRRHLDARRKVIQILARPRGAMAPHQAESMLDAALTATAWGPGRSRRVTLASPDSTGRAVDDLLFEIAVPYRIGSPRYASWAHELVQHLYDVERNGNPVFSRVEADIPVSAYGRSPVGERGRVALRGVDPLSLDHGWVRRELQVTDALAHLGLASLTGLGIRVGHPDSGYSDHGALGLTNLDLTTDRDVISSDDDARDPLRKPSFSWFNPLPNSGHGTSTASVIVGDGDGDPAGFHGLAIGATLVPIRTTESVVQVFDHDVAKAVRWARQVGCQIVSMSLGGKGLFGLQDAIDEALATGMIVMAAAGNKVHFVTAPASYDNCLAVAATGPGAVPWDGSSRGEAVDVSAPGHGVWAAMFDWSSSPPGTPVRQSDGTSYSVAHLAGIAALWLAAHGSAALAARYGPAAVQSAFVAVLNSLGSCTVPPGWDAGRWGTGVVDALGVVTAPLPDPTVLTTAAARARGGSDDARSRLLAHIDGTDAVDVGPAGARSTARHDGERWLERALGRERAADDEVLRRFEGELAYHLAEQTDLDAAMTPATTRRGATYRSSVADARAIGASPQLLALLHDAR